MRLFVVLVALCAFPPALARGQDLCGVLANARIVAEDGTYLGKVASTYDRESIFNEYGAYGSEYSRTSIWNKYGTYGSEYSNQSPFNAYTSSPPMIIKSGEIVAYLTVNRSKRGAVNPHALRSCEF